MALSVPALDGNFFRPLPVPFVLPLRLLWADPLPFVLPSCLLDLKTDCYKNRQQTVKDRFWVKERLRNGKERAMNGCTAVPWPFDCLKGTVSRHKMNGYSFGWSGQGTGEEPFIFWVENRYRSFTRSVAFGRYLSRSFTVPLRFGTGPFNRWPKPVHGWYSDDLRHFMIYCY